MDPSVKLSSILTSGRHHNDQEGVVHVMIQRPPPPPPRGDEPPAKRQRVDMTLEGLWRLVDWQLDKLPTVGQLKALLRKPPPVQLELCPQAVGCVDSIFDVNARPISCSSLQNRLNGFYELCKSPASPDASEASWQNVYNWYFSMFADLLKAKFRDVKEQRNKEDNSGSTSGTLKPDFLLTWNGLAFVRAEEKNAQTGINVPLRELTSKMNPWNPVIFANLRYILDCATSGPKIHVVAIDRSLTRHVLAKLDVVNDRVGALKVFFNLALLAKEMLHFVDLPASDVTFILNDDNVTDRRTLRMESDGFLRTIKKSISTPDVEIRRLHDVYEALSSLNSKGSEETHLQTVVSLREENNDLITKLSPIGYVRRPRLAEVGAWLHDLLSALKYWHECKYCHGDIRESKIIYVPDDDSGYWALIGMDKSHEAGTTTIRLHGECLYTRRQFHHDLLQVGELMEKMKFVLPDHLKIMQEFLLSAVALELTATKALAKLKKLLPGSSVPLSSG